jgi:hypothetical protein
VRGITVTPGYKIPHGTAAAPLQAADDFQRRHRWLAFPVAVVKKYGEDQAGQRAAQSAMNGVWNVPRRRYPNFLLRRLRGLAWLFILGGGLLLASVVSGFAAAADTAWSGPAGVAASTLVNMLLFLVGFRVLTVRDVSLRTLLPGAVDQRVEVSFGDTDDGAGRLDRSG